MKSILDSRMVLCALLAFLLVCVAVRSPSRIGTGRSPQDNLAYTIISLKTLAGAVDHPRSPLRPTLQAVLDEIRIVAGLGTVVAPQDPVPPPAAAWKFLPTLSGAPGGLFFTWLPPLEGAAFTSHRFAPRDPPPKWLT